MAVGRTGSRTRMVFAGTVVVFVGVACGIDAVGTATDESTSGAASSSSSSGTSGTTSSSGSNGSGDGAIDAPPRCVPSAEVCTDGIDNDCNGKTDCEDPACSEYTCATSETGWTIVSVRAPNGGDAGSDAGVCPNGWTNPRALLDNVRAAGATCACSCGDRLGNPCANGTTTANFRTGSMSCNDGSESLTLDGTCRALGFGWNGSFNAVDVPPPSIVQVACNASAALPPVLDDGALFLCDLATSSAPIACTGGTCVLAPGPDKICLLQAGDTATCPAAYPAKKVLAPSFTDGRTCGACSCTTNATACSNRQIGFYTNAGCNQDERLSTVDDTCNTISSSGTPSHYQFKATPNGACVAAAATAAINGALSVTTPSTLCCPP